MNSRVSNVLINNSKNKNTFLNETISKDIVPTNLNANYLTRISSVASYGTPKKIHNTLKQSQLKEMQVLEQRLEGMGVSIKKISNDDVELSKDIAILKIAYGLFFARKHEQELNKSVEIIDNFNYKIELKKVIELTEKNSIKLKDSMSDRDRRLYTIFKDTTFKIYFQTLDKHIELNEGKNQVNLELIAILLMQRRFDNTDFRNTKKLFKKNTGVTRRRILSRKIKDLLYDTEYTKLENMIENFTKSHINYIIADEIVSLISKLKTKIRRI